MSILLFATLLCGLNPDFSVVDSAIWKENGNHVFVIADKKYDVGGECYDISNENGVHKYTWLNREGMYETTYVKNIYMEVDGQLIRVQE